MTCCMVLCLFYVLYYADKMIWPTVILCLFLALCRHNDLAYWYYETVHNNVYSVDMRKNLQKVLPNSTIHTDIPRIRQGRLSAQVPHAQLPFSHRGCMVDGHCGNPGDFYPLRFMTCNGWKTHGISNFTFQKV